MGHSPLKTTLSENTKPLSLNNDSNLTNDEPRMSTLERHADESVSKSNLSSLKLTTQTPVNESLCNFLEVGLQETSSLSLNDFLFDHSLPMTFTNSSLSTGSQRKFSVTANTVSSNPSVSLNNSSTPETLFRGYKSNPASISASDPTVSTQQSVTSCEEISDGVPSNVNACLCSSEVIQSGTSELQADVISESEGASLISSAAVTTLDSSFSTSTFSISTSTATLSTLTSTSFCESSSAAPVDVVKQSQSPASGDSFCTSFALELLRASETVAQEFSTSSPLVSSSACSNLSTTVNCSASIETGGLPLSVANNGKHIILYRSSGGSSRAGIRLLAMQDSETLSTYLKQFGDTILEAFADVELECRRDFIDTFIEGALDEHVSFLNRIKNSKIVKNSRKPLAAFITEVATLIVPGV